MWSVEIVQSALTVVYSLSQDGKLLDPNGDRRYTGDLAFLRYHNFPGVLGTTTTMGSTSRISKTKGKFINAFLLKKVTATSFFYI